MFISCRCGERVTDNTDYIPWKARLIPDMQWEELMLILEAGGERIDRHPHAKQQAFHAMWSALKPLFRSAWQCSSCGRIYVENKAGELHSFVPESSAPGSNDIFRGEEPKQTVALPHRRSRWWEVWK